MTALAKTYVLDANSVLDYIDDGPGAGTTERLLLQASRSEVLLLISVLNFGETFYWVWRERGREKANNTADDLLKLPLQVVPVDLAQALKARELKATHKIPFVDCIAAALCIIKKATLVTSDRDFEKLGRKFPVHWIARPRP